VRHVKKFWETLGSRTVTMSPREHDERLAWVSHLPHAVATALVHLSLKDDAIDVAGPGFADVTRVASGDPCMWTDILRSNRHSMRRSVNRLIRQLEQLRTWLDADDAAALLKWLAAGKTARDAWVDRRYKKKVLPP
jgi:prephenate dehydrogenase